MIERPRQTCCQIEPAYPGLETVVYSIRFPHLTAHRPTERCPIEGPHEVNDCGEWNP